MCDTLDIVCWNRWTNTKPECLGTWHLEMPQFLGTWQIFLQVRLPDAALGVVRPLLPGCPAKKRLPWPELMEDSQLKMRGIHICSAEAFLSASRIQRQ